MLPSNVGVVCFNKYGFSVRLTGVRGSISRVTTTVGISGSSCVLLASLERGSGAVLPSIVDVIWSDRLGVSVRLTGALGVGFPISVS